MVPLTRIFLCWHVLFSVTCTPHVSVREVVLSLPPPPPTTNTKALCQILPPPLLRTTYTPKYCLAYLLSLDGTPPHAVRPAAG